MDRTTLKLRGIGLALTVAVAASCGCQTVRTPEERIAKSNIPKEFTKVSMPEYVVEPPDLILDRGARGAAGAGDHRRAAGPPGR